MKEKKGFKPIGKGGPGFRQTEAGKEANEADLKETRAHLNGLRSDMAENQRGTIPKSAIVETAFARPLPDVLPQAFPGRDS